MFTDGQLDGQTDAREFPDRKKSSSGLHPEELIISKSDIISKGPSNLAIHYLSMPEPTDGLEGSLVPGPTGILSSNTCPGNSNIPEYTYNITC